MFSTCCGWWGHMKSSSLVIIVSVNKLLSHSRPKFQLLPSTSIEIISTLYTTSFPLGFFCPRLGRLGAAWDHWCQCMRDPGWTELWFKQHFAPTQGFCWPNFVTRHFDLKCTKGISNSHQYIQKLSWSLEMFRTFTISMAWKLDK